MFPDAASEIRYMDFDSHSNSNADICPLQNHAHKQDNRTECGSIQDKDISCVQRVHSIHFYIHHKQQYCRSLNSFHILLGNTDGGNEHNTNTCAGGIKGFIFFFGYVIGFVQQFQPIPCFICFFACDLEFGNKVCFTVSILCFTDICPMEVPLLPI